MESLGDFERYLVNQVRRAGYNIELVQRRRQCLQEMLKGPRRLFKDEVSKIMEELTHLEYAQRYHNFEFESAQIQLSRLRGSSPPPTPPKVSLISAQDGLLPTPKVEVKISRERSYHFISPSVGGPSFVVLKCDEDCEDSGIVVESEDQEDDLMPLIAIQKEVNDTWKQYTYSCLLFNKTGRIMG